MPYINLKKIFITMFFSMIIPLHANAFTLPTIPGVSGGDAGGFSLGDGRTELVDKFLKQGVLIKKPETSYFTYDTKFK